MTTATDWSAESGSKFEGSGPIEPYPGSTESCVQIYMRELPRWKRALDLVGVVLLAPVIAPIWAVVAVYIRIVSPGPVLFLQSRVGHGGELFPIYKFRTMHVAEVSRDEAHRGLVASYTDACDAMKKPDYQDQLISGGNWLRRFSIDELPQLLNVIKGNMSLVGPRPDVLLLEDYEPPQLRRFEVLPGMTGLWQVSGKNRLSFEQMLELDIAYIDTQSLAGDLSILARTVNVLLFEQNE